MRFDIDAYKRRAGQLDDHDIDYTSFRDAPLDPVSLRTLRYMRDVEQHTVCYLGELLAGRSRHDADITTFLTFWAFEEYWHGEAIGKVLDAHPTPAAASLPDRNTTAANRRRHASTVRPSRHATLATAVGRVASRCTDHFVAVHMTWGALNEWCTQAGYRRLASTAGHPVLADLLGRISRQEGRHIDFYASQAAERLAANRTAQRLTRHALVRYWAPVGSGIMPPAEVGHVVRHLFTGADGHAACDRIDRNLARLPGLAGLTLVRAQVERHRRPEVAW